jgi:hypothetical protein
MATDGLIEMNSNESKTEGFKGLLDCLDKPLPCFPEQIMQITHGGPIFSNGFFQFDDFLVRRFLDPLDLIAKIQDFGQFIFSSLDPTSSLHLRKQVGR